MGREPPGPPGPRGDAAQRSADGRTEDPGHRPGRRRGQTARPADQRPGQARRALRRPLPADRLRAVQPGERERPAGSRCSPSTRATASTGTSPRPGACRTCWATTSRPCPRSSGSARAGTRARRTRSSRSLNLINDERPDLVIVFGADHVYRMDPRQMVGAAPRRRRRGDRRRHPRAAPRGQRVRRDPDRRRRPQDRGVPGEARRPARAARPAGRDVRLDGQLRVQHRGAARRAAHRRRRTRTASTTWAATSSRC